MRVALDLLTNVLFMEIDFDEACFRDFENIPELGAIVKANGFQLFLNYLKGMGFDIGITASAIIPVEIGDIGKTLEAGKLLLEAGVNANLIMYPAVSKKNPRIKLHIMATNTKAHLD